MKPHQKCKRKCSLHLHTPHTLFKNIKLPQLRRPGEVCFHCKYLKDQVSVTKSPLAIPGEQENSFQILSGCLCLFFLPSNTFTKTTFIHNQYFGILSWQHSVGKHQMMKKFVSILFVQFLSCIEIVYTYYFKCLLERVEILEYPVENCSVKIFLPAIWAGTAKQALQWAEALH